MMMMAGDDNIGSFFSSIHPSIHSSSIKYMKICHHHHLKIQIQILRRQTLYIFNTHTEREKRMARFLKGFNKIKSKKLERERE